MFTDHNSLPGCDEIIIDRGLHSVKAGYSDGFKQKRLCLGTGRNSYAEPETVGLHRPHGEQEWLLVCGTKLHDLLEEGRDGARLIDFRQLKWCLHGTSRVEKWKEVQEQLDNIGLSARNFEWLLAEHFREIRAIADGKADLLSGRSGAARKYYYSIPDHFDLFARMKMRDILRQAGFPNATPVSEAEAAGAWGVYRGLHTLERKRSGVEFEKVTTMTIDAGGGSADLSLYRVNAYSSDRANLQAVPEGRSINVDFGGQRLTRVALNYIKDQIAMSNNNCSQDTTMSQALDAKLCEMNISENYLDLKLTETFERYKTSFAGTGEEMVFHVSGRSSPGQPKAGRAAITNRSSVSVTVKPHITERWMRREYRRLHDAVSEKMHGGVTYLCLTGGSMNSPYFTRKIREDFGRPDLDIFEDGSDGSCCEGTAVIRGWMARRELGLPEIPQNLCFCILWTEAFDPQTHEAADREGRIKRNDFTGKRYAKNRVRVLLRPHDAAALQGNDLGLGPFHEYLVAPVEGENFIEHQVYCTDREVEDGEDAAQPDNNLPPWLTPFDKPHVLEIPLDRLRKYESLRCSKNSVSCNVRHRVWARYIVERYGTSVKCSWELAPPSYRPFSPSGQFMTSDNPNGRGERAIVHEAEPVVYMKRGGLPSDELNESQSHREASTMPMPFFKRPGEAQSTGDGGTGSTFDDEDILCEDAINECIDFVSGYLLRQIATSGRDPSPSQHSLLNDSLPKGGNSRYQMRKRQKVDYGRSGSDHRSLSPDAEEG